MDTGYALIKALEAKNLRPKAALWVAQEAVWRLLLHVPKLQSFGISTSYQRLQQVIQASPESFPALADISLIDDANPYLNAIRQAISVPADADNLAIRLTRTNFFGLYIEDAYVYRLG